MGIQANDQMSLLVLLDLRFCDFTAKQPDAPECTTQNYSTAPSRTREYQPHKTMVVMAESTGLGGRFPCLASVNTHNIREFEKV